MLRTFVVIQVVKVEVEVCRSYTLLWKGFSVVFPSRGFALVCICIWICQLPIPTFLKNICQMPSHECSTWWSKGAKTSVWFRASTDLLSGHLFNWAHTPISLNKLSVTSCQSSNRLSPSVKHQTFRPRWRLHTALSRGDIYRPLMSDLHDDIAANEWLILLSPDEWIQRIIVLLFSDPSHNRSAFTNAGTPPGMGSVDSCMWELLGLSCAWRWSKGGRCWAVGTRMCTCMWRYVKTFMFMWACVSPALLLLHIPAVSDFQWPWINRMGWLLFSFIIFRTFRTDRAATFQ